MRLYTRTGATALDDPEFGHFDADENGGFDLPDDLSDRLHRFHERGRPQWETDIERQQRLIAEELERRQDPATLLSLMERFLGNAEQVVTGPAAKPVGETLAKQQAPVGPEPEAAGADGSPSPAKAPRAPRKTAASRRTTKSE